MVDPGALPTLMTALACALPMPPGKVLAQVEAEPLEGLPADWEDAPSWGEPGEVDVEVLPRWMRAGLERGPQEGAQTQAGPGPAELSDGEDPTGW